MKTSLNRRGFIKQSALAGASLAALGSVTTLRADTSPAKKVLVGIVGLGRGKAHIEGYLGVPNVEIAYVCDVDENRLAEGVRAVEKRQTTSPKAVKDFRKILEDKSVDILSIAMPNFWHTPAAILACDAGKHVYVEKPGSHNPWESEMIVAAARRHKRLVQMGNQRRSYPAMIEAISRLRTGDIGKVLYARCWYFNERPSIGHGKQVPVPATLDYTLWQGPTPERPYVDNLAPYNWHWRWHYGGGEMANNGIHTLDLARWGLGVEYPRTVTFNGGRYHYDDDQETPDTGTAVFDFGTCGATWEVSSCHQQKPTKQGFVSFYGDTGMLEMTSSGFTIYDLAGKEIWKNPGKASDIPHFSNFVECVRNGGKLNSEIAEGQKSTLLCHLANIAYRTGHTVHFNPETKKIINDTDAQKLWKREYRPGWEPVV